MMHRAPGSTTTPVSLPPPAEGGGFGRLAVAIDVVGGVPRSGVRHPRLRVGVICGPRAPSSSGLPRLQHQPWVKGFEWFDHYRDKASIRMKTFPTGDRQPPLQSFDPCPRTSHCPLARAGAWAGLGPPTTGLRRQGADPWGCDISLRQNEMRNKTYIIKKSVVKKLGRRSIPIRKSSFSSTLAATLASPITITYVLNELRNVHLHSIAPIDNA